MIKLDLTLPDFAAVFKRRQPDIMNALAAAMQTNRAMMFDKDGADNGKKRWKDPDPHFRVGRPLQDTGVLRKSMAPQPTGMRPVRSPDGILRFTGNRVTIGTTLAKARILNDGTASLPGGVIRPKVARALAYPDAQGNTVFSMSVKFPGRRMDEISPADAEEFSQTLANYIAGILNGKN